MRVAVLTHSPHRVGGAETYLDTVLPPLAARGHQVAVCTEMGDIDGASRLAAGAAEAEFTIGHDVDGFLRRLRAWRPDVVFLHGLDAVTTECALIERWPAVFFAHTYHGTCISGSKTRSFPVVTPCSRVLGPGCLVQYLPRRCGGLSPSSMLRNYRLQRARKDLLPRYARVLTLSRHMRAEYVRHGADERRVHVLPYFAPERSAERDTSGASTALRLLFAGRMDRLKGAHLFLDALPIVAAALKRPVKGVLVGDGQCRPALERQAAWVAGRSDGVKTEFRGWLGKEAMTLVFREVDLLVVPSVWPEPFGLIGSEAAAHGLPAAAFDVGGITDWLVDGRSGHVAIGRLDATTLADAIVRCVERPEHYRALSQGALEVAGSHVLASHVTALEAHLAAETRPVAPVLVSGDPTS